MKIRKEGFLLFRDMKFLVRKNSGYCIFQSLVTNYENQIEFRILKPVVRGGCLPGYLIPQRTPENEKSPGYPVISRIERMKISK